MKSKLLDKKIEKSYIARRLSKIAPYDEGYTEKTLKRMSLKQLKVLEKIIDNLTAQNTSKKECRSCRKFNIGMMMYEGFRWKIQEEELTPWQMDFDKDTQTILVPEEMIMYFITLSNPGQPQHRVKLISRYPRQ